MYLIFPQNFPEIMRFRDKNRSGVYRPMLSVTVMIFKDIVESVTLLKEEA